MLCISRSEMQCFSNRAGSYERRGNEANGCASIVTNPTMDGPGRAHEHIIEDAIALPCRAHKRPKRAIRRTYVL